MNAIITVVGKDKVGIMAGVCNTLQKVTEDSSSLILKIV